MSEIDMRRVSLAFEVLPPGQSQMRMPVEPPIRDSKGRPQTHGAPKKSPFVGSLGVFIFILAGALSLGACLLVGWQNSPLARHLVLPGSGPIPVDSLDILRFTPPVAPRSATEVVLPQSWGGQKVGALPKGSVTHFSDIPPDPSYGDAWYVAETGTYWIYCQPWGYSHPIWVDP